eukprot:CAMPEP_0171972766 /NCGR_PEP_ID=MMETSP0993-20121228/224504_1 /TAXON_ID=483369 /ORGANISM="non described non described, Strain CCMP2098" /LENGTH=62 /DNA_ID=CAMNT_0012623415 /DNA_START=202 /DNA_END=387 /DNA_ORIENTATION=-
MEKQKGNAWHKTKEKAEASGEAPAWFEKVREPNLARQAERQKQLHIAVRGESGGGGGGGGSS